MDRKVPHVLGHEVAGIVLESQDARYPVGSRVFPHHHAPCMACPLCVKKQFVHCEQWRKSKLDPGGMAERFSVPAENLTDTLRVDHLRSVDAALIEPLACVAKSLRLAGALEANPPVAVVGLGVMGLMHALILGDRAVGFDLDTRRVEWARGLGLDARTPDQEQMFDVIIVCPGNQSALDFAFGRVRAGGTILLFAPFGPEDLATIDLHLAYFMDFTMRSAYSCGPDDTRLAAEWIGSGMMRAEQVVSDFISLEALPGAYQAMKEQRILKPMVLF
jgi:L-iditol 2-dehydrogenase